jgi:VanZ family protein
MIINLLLVPEMGPTLKYQGPTILWALFIFIMCTIKLGKIEGSPLFFPGFDKLVHCGFYFVFVIFYCNGLIRQHHPDGLPYKYVAIVLILAIAYGGTIEILQWLVFTWREGEWGDLFADSVGACMGMFSVLIISGAVKHVKK